MPLKLPHSCNKQNTVVLEFHPNAHSGIVRESVVYAFQPDFNCSGRLPYKIYFGSMRDDSPGQHWLQLLGHLKFDVEYGHLHKRQLRSEHVVLNKS